MIPNKTSQRVFFTIGVGGFIISLFFIMLGLWMHYRSDGADIALRWREADYVMQGINPADVYFGKHPQIEEIGKPNVYPPWSYGYMVVFLGWTPFSVARPVFVFLAMLGAVAIWRMAYVWSSRPNNDRSFGMLGMGLVLASSTATLISFSSMNYALLVAALMGTVVLLLQKQWCWLAGIVWALAMVKPQLAVLLAIPLLFKRRFDTLIVGAIITLVSTIAVSVVLNENPLFLLHQVKAAGEGYSSISTTGILSFLVVLDVASVPTTLVIMEVLGVAFASVVCWRYRNSNLGWLYWGAACCAVGTIWTYVQTPNWILIWPLLVCSLIVYRDRGNVADLIVLIVLFLSFAAPRLLSLWPNDYYVAIYNLLRYGTWCFAIVYLGGATAPEKMKLPPRRACDASQKW